MGVWQPGARLIGAYSDDDNYFYVEGANAQDSAANAGATSMRLVRRLAGVETVIGKRLMFTSPGEVTGSLGISWGPYGVRTAGLCPGFPFGSGPFYRGDPGPGLLAGIGTGTITGTAEFYGFGLGKALSLFQYSNIYNLCTGFPECTPCSLADGSMCDELTCHALRDRHVVAGLGSERRLLAGGRHLRCAAGGRLSAADRRCGRGCLRSSGRAFGSTSSTRQSN